MMRPIVAGAMLMLAGAATAQEAAAPASPSGPVRMTSAQIAEYNASFSPTDPQFIKCVRQEGPGSMVKRRVCRTNEDWNQRSGSASDEARAIVDNIQLHGSTHGEEPPGSLMPATSPN